MVFLKAVKYYCKRTYLEFLRIFFGFHPWHTSALYEVRKYKSAVVSIANRIHPDSVIEIGCGLGEIINRIDSQDRVGIDNSQSVIHAARFISRSYTKFIIGDVETLSLNRTFKMCIAVNAIQTIWDSDIAQRFIYFCNIHNITYLLIDRVNNLYSKELNEQFYKLFDSCFRKESEFDDNEGIRTLILLKRCIT